MKRMEQLLDDSAAQAVLVLGSVVADSAGRAFTQLNAGLREKIR